MNGASERGAAPSAAGRLRVDVVRGGAPATCEIGPGDEMLTIGRSREQSRLVIDDKSVSRRHAAIECVGGRWRVRDLKSLNGVRLRGRPVPPDGAELADGDELQLGVAVLRVRISGPPRDAATTIVESPAPAPPPVASSRAEAERPRPGRSEPPRAPASRPRREPLERFNRFAIYRRMMADGQRRLDLAEDTGSGRQVLLLRMEPGAGGFFGFGKRKLKRAYEQAQRLAHDNVLAPTELSEAESCQLVVYPAFDGMTAAALLADHGRDLRIELGAYIGRELCRALAYLAGAPGAGARPAVGDREVLIGRDGRVVLLVTPEAAVDEHYRSPEEDAGEKGGITSAVFSAGILIYELLARERIDSGRKLTLPSIDTVRLQVPASLADATMRAVEVRPQDRIATPGELERELDEALGALTPGFGPAQVARWITERLPE